MHFCAKIKNVPRTQMKIIFLKFFVTVTEIAICSRTLVRFSPLVINKSFQATSAGKIENRITHALAGNNDVAVLPTTQLIGTCRRTTCS